MVATVVMVVLVGLVIQITSDVLNVWNRSSGKLTANAQARIAMDLLTQDLETAVLRNNGQQWLRVEAEGDVGSPTAGQTVALHLFSPAMDRPDGPGDISAIAYRLAYAPAYESESGNAPDTFAIYRSIESPQFTFDNLMGSGDTGSPQLELTDSLHPFWAEAAVTQPANFLAGNITDFKIYVYGIDPATDDIVAINDQDGDRKLTVPYIFGGNGASTIKPLYAEIVLTVLSDEGLRILELDEPFAGTGYSDVKDIVREFGEVFTRRVNLAARPL
ncbi:MAG: hypothetical protein GVY36_16750 [Verrucomicrobia bacterium]|nr:hypothetical protein [Verrucomicrobiota bacterium]